VNRLRTRLAAVLGAAVTCAAAAPETPPDLSTLFPEQAPIVVEGTGIARLSLPAEVLDACRSDLSDLRVLDREGREVPFVVDSGPAPDERFEVGESLTPEILAVDRRRIDRESGPPLWQERFDLAVRAEPPEGGRRVLVFEVGRASFVRRVDVFSVAADGGRSELVAGASIFRLRDPLRERLEVELPEVPSGTLSVTLAGEDGPHLEPVIRLESSRELAAGDLAGVPLVETGRRRLEGRTEIELARPRGVVPDVIVIASSTAAFNRRLEIWDEGPAAADPVLGVGTVFRLSTLATVEGLSVPVAPARGDRLRVIIEDGDSPPLGDLEVRAVVRRPALLFALPEGPPSEQSGRLLFGGGRAFRPRYDLEGLADADEGSLGELTAALIDPARLASARLGAAVPNPRFDDTPVLAFAQRPGAEIEPGDFSHRRSLSVQPSTEGLSRLELDPEDTAVLRADLADLRIIDSASRQWAYLLEARGTSETRVLPVSAETPEDGVSRYTLTLPASPAVVDRVVLDVREPFFDREFELVSTAEDAEERTVTVARGRLIRRANDPRPVTITFAPWRVDTLALRIEDGDDAPLRIEEVEARFPLPEVFFAAPAGEYELLLGNPDAVAPRYELERIRGVVLAVESATASVGRLSLNPDFRPGSRLFDREGLLMIAMWAAVAALVIILTTLTLRLARSERDHT
jgi:hypothetical protein